VDSETVAKLRAGIRLPGMKVGQIKYLSFCVERKWVRLEIFFETGSVCIIKFKSGSF
jgi:hypothetical protein